MGSCYVSRTFKDCSRDELKRKVADAISMAAHESGHSYSGDWGSKNNGLEFLTQTFASASDAEDYIQDHNDKWEALMAARVPVRVPVTAENKGAKLTALEAKVKALCDKQRDFMPAIRTRTLNMKSALKSCDHCNSKLNIKAYLERTRSQSGDCPICGKNLLLTNTDIAAKTKIEADLQTAQKQLEIARNERSKALTKTVEYEWVVGGWCSS